MITETELVIKVVAMPSAMNPEGDIFGGWIVSQMDMAAYLHARKQTSHKVVTVAIDQLAFLKPVFAGDCLLCYAKTEKIGRTSVTIKIEALVERRHGQLIEQVTEGRFVFVAINPDRQSVPFKGE